MPKISIFEQTFWPFWVQTLIRHIKQQPSNDENKPAEVQSFRLDNQARKYLHPSVYSRRAAWSKAFNSSQVNTSKWRLKISWKHRTVATVAAPVYFYRIYRYAAENTVLFFSEHCRSSRKSQQTDALFRVLCPFRVNCIAKEEIVFWLNSAAFLM